MTSSTLCPSTPVTNPVVNFYILSDSDLRHRLIFVFRLVEKAYKEKLSTLIIGSDEAQIAAIDRLIWTAKPACFIPHEVISEQLISPLPSILLADSVLSLSQVNFQPQLVIDLGYDATPLYFPKIMLVANQHQDVLANARMKYQHYIENDITPVVHKL
ncbi:MAG: DNA polymerase III subunit chi [Ostreibacterium sp.]